VGHKVTATLLVDIRSLDHPEDRNIDLQHPRLYEVVVDGKSIGRMKPHLKIGFSKCAEIEEIVGDLPEMLTENSGSFEVKVKLSNAVSNSVTLSVR
jgi:hypothetical protein